MAKILYVKMWFDSQDRFLVANKQFPHNLALLDKLHNKHRARTPVSRSYYEAGNQWCDREEATESKIKAQVQ